MPTTSKRTSHSTKKPNGQGALRAAEMRALDSVMIERMQLMRLAGITYGGQRDTYEVLGYPRQLTTSDYHDRYARGGIAGRVVDALPKATWRSEMWIEENDNPDKLTTLEQQWEDLADQFQLQTLLLRVDILSQLSSYAVLLIGAQGELNTELPKGQPGSLIYLTPFSGGGGPGTNRGRDTQRTLSNMDGDATILELEDDPTNPRFGLPRFYQLKRLDINNPSFQQPVHWSRVIHIAEGCLDNEVYGQPSLERVWNLLDDLDKITGGGGEAAWLNANRGLHLDIDKDIKDLTDTERAHLQTQADEYQHQIRRMIRTRGVSVQTLGSDVPSIGPNADAILTQIAGAKAIPKRILTGSEMGELASSQDRENWKDQVVGRQEGYAGPYIVRRFVDRLIEYGYLAKSKSYDVKWSPIQTMTEEEKATGAQRWASTNKTQGEIVFTNDELREHWYSKKPLSEEEKQLPMPVMAPGMGGGGFGQSGEKAPPGPSGGLVPRAAAAAEELIEVVEQAIKTNDTDVIDQILGIKHLGGPGSGHFGHEGRPGEVGGSAPSGEGGGGTAGFAIPPTPASELQGRVKTDEEKTADRAEQFARLEQLKEEWSTSNEALKQLIRLQEDPRAKPEVQRLIDQQKALMTEIHKLDLDPGGIEGLKLPGGPRDVVIVGAGPGGIEAGIMAATDGLDAHIIDAQTEPGGQSKGSGRIENFYGFPAGIAGDDLARRGFEEAQRVGATTQLGVRVIDMYANPETGIKTLTLSNGQQIEARAVIIAGGVEFKTLGIPNDNAPNVVYDSRKFQEMGPGGSVLIVGGSNGAAQAALGAVDTAGKVTVVARHSITENMSDIQIHALRSHPKIRDNIIEGDSIAALRINDAGRVTTVVTKAGREIDVQSVGVFIGGSPDVKWAPGVKTSNGKVVVSTGLETNIPGVFAVGDVRVGSAGRIILAAGDGALAAANLFRYYERVRNLTPAEMQEVSGLAAKEPVAKKLTGAEREAAYKRWDAYIAKLSKVDADYPWTGQTIDAPEFPEEQPAEKPRSASKKAPKK